MSTPFACVVAASRLLHYMRELMADELLSALARRLVLAGREVNVGALRIRERAHGGGVVAFMDPD